MTLRQKLFILFAMICGFFIGCEYAIARPVSNALFITAYTTSFLPFAWIATVPLNLLLVGLYNQYLPRLGCWKMFQIMAGCIALGNIFFALFLGTFKGLAFVFYIWKEVYILLMLQQLWSVIHATMDLKRAKYLYGILFGAGALGALFGSSVPSFLAVKFGSENLLFLSFPIYCFLFFAYRFLLKFTDQIVLNSPKKESPFSAFKHGMRLIQNSKLLSFILIIVACMQVAATLTDYQFNTFLEKTIPSKDLRTEYTGRVFGLVHVITLTLQLVGAFLIVHLLGLKRSHFAIPFALGLVALSFLFLPIFPVIAFSYILIKSLDFSLFGVVKEMLYIPLSQDDKFRAKAVIDVFAYRSSKVIASFLIIVLQATAGLYVSSVLAFLGVLLFIGWCSFVYFFFTPPETAQVTHQKS